MKKEGWPQKVIAAHDAFEARMDEVGNHGHTPMTQAHTDALRLVNPHRDITENLRQAAVDLHPWFVGDAKTFSVDCALPAYLNEAADEIERLRATAPASPLPGGGLPADVVRLVIAARRVAYEGAAEDDLRALDIAAEAFASRVPWDDEPDELPAAPTGEPK